jgi:peptidyl-prolyl cis-trans isomerase C
MTAALALVALVTGAAPSLGAMDPQSAALLAGEAERLGLAKKPDVAKRLEQERTRLAVEQHLREVSSKAPAPSEAEVRAAYHAAADSARLQVVVRATREDAASALERLRKGGPLADEVKGSVDPATRDKGGDTGWIARGKLPPAVAADAFARPLESWGGPYELGGRWVIARAVERKIGPDPGEAAALAEARGGLVREREERARAEYVERLRQGAKVRVDEKFISGAAGRKPTAADREHVVAQVGARSVRYREVLDATGGMAAAHGSAGPGAAMQIGIARQLVDRALLEEAAAKAKAGSRPEAREALAAARREILVAAYYDDVAARTPAPSRADVEARYRERAAEFQAPAARRCAHVVASTEAKAKDLQLRIARGEPFDQVAREASEDATTKAKGGDVGEIADDRLERMEPALAGAIRKLAPGRVSDPVKSAMGWHLLRCEQLPPRTRPLTEVEDRISGALRLERIQAAVASRLGQLKAAQAAGSRASGKAESGRVPPPR